MRYMKLDAVGRQELWGQLEAMPAFLEETFAGLGAERATLPGPEGLFSPVEQVWHLADLERDGFAANRSTPVGVRSTSAELRWRCSGCRSKLSQPVNYCRAEGV